jgi:hypothetical protein
VIRLRVRNEERAMEPSASSEAAPHNASAQARGSGAPSVIVETWCLQCERGRWRTVPAVVVPLADGGHPHECARGVAESFGLRADVVHSTSWRMVDGAVVLTYVVVFASVAGMDAHAAASMFDVHRDHDHRRGTEAGHTSSADVDACAPRLDITGLEVVHHALHHLALLARTNTVIAAALTPAARAALAPLAPAGAGVLPTAYAV